MQFQFYFLFLNKKCVSHTPKLELHIVLNVLIEWKDHTREMRKLVGLGMACSIPPNLNGDTLFLKNKTMKGKKNCDKMDCLP
jgi:hypothetical protein